MRMSWLWGDVWVQSRGSLLGSLTGLQLGLLAPQQQGKREAEHTWSEAAGALQDQRDMALPESCPPHLSLCGKSQKTQAQRTLRFETAHKHFGVMKPRVKGSYLSHW